jgi:hypothetical protein
MKNKYSIASLFLISIIVVAFRFIPEKYPKNSPLIVTTWDALGYYIYLPSFFIYHDYKELKWLPEIDKKYQVSGGWVYQANKYKNGNYLFSYTGGVAIIESPLFFFGHIAAKNLGYKTDGFSPPYQFSIAFGAIFYFFLSLLLLRSIILKYFSDKVTAATLLLLVLASNIIQYVSVDDAMSHSFIFPLYVLILYFTIKWHERPSLVWASLIGVTVGLATISRPTEAIMVLIPILWGTQTKELASEKWKMVKQNKLHVYFLAFSGFIAILPQLIYWKLTTGSIFYEMPSRWDFLNPHFRVLIGWESGWFIYTPVAIFFVAGLFFIKQFPFKKSVIVFCLLSIYIVISHHDWRYGATYSCRALSHIYPVFALPLAAFIDRFNVNRMKYFFSLFGIYLIVVNLFQLRQYNQTILHYRDMNMKYYLSIYLNPHPSPLDMSLLDTNDRMSNERRYHQSALFYTDSSLKITIPEYSEKDLFVSQIGNNITNMAPENSWIKVEMRIKLNKPDIWGCYINSELRVADSVKRNKIRMLNPITKQGQENDYAFDIKIPPYFHNCNFKLYLRSSSQLNIDIKKISLQYFYK